ncbi:MAG: MmgE/PrpD family protein [Opitutaceae bacterium]
MTDSTQKLPPPDALLVEMASFAANPPAVGDNTLQASMHCLLDSMGVALMALQQPECARWLGPVVPGTNLPLGARLLGTDLELDPATAAFDLALCMRWLGLQCMRPGRETISLADPIAPILSAADWLGRNIWHSGQFRAYGSPLASRDMPPTMKDVLCAVARAQEIQGALAEANSWIALGLDPSVLSRVASTAVLIPLLGGTRDQILAAVSLAWQAGVNPLADPHRSAWTAATDASQAVSLSLRALAGDQGWPNVLTTPRTGFQDACHGGTALKISFSIGSSVPEEAVYNLAHPDALSAQTAAEAALRLHPAVAGRLGDIERVDVATHAAGLALGAQAESNPRRSLVRAVAASLVFGRLGDEQLSGPCDSAVCALEAKIRVREEAGYTADSYDPDKRALPNSIQVFFRGGAHTERAVCEYPIGHYRRHTEAVPLLFSKAEAAISGRFDEARAEEIIDLFDRPSGLLGMPVTQFVDLWIA